MSGLSKASTSKLETFLVLQPRISLRLKKMQTSGVQCQTSCRGVGSWGHDSPGRSFMPADKRAPRKLLVASLEYSHSGI